MPLRVSAAPSSLDEAETDALTLRGLQALGLCLTGTCSRPGSQSRQPAMLRASLCPGEFPGFRSQSRGLGLPSRGCHCLFLLGQQVSKG